MRHPNRLQHQDLHQLSELQLGDIAEQLLQQTIAAAGVARLDARDDVHQTALEPIVVV